MNAVSQDRILPVASLALASGWGTVRVATGWTLSSIVSCSSAIIGALSGRAISMPN